MVEYHTYKFNGKIADVDIDALEQKFRNMIDTNRRLHLQAHEDYSRLLELATSVYGPKSRQVRYLRNEPVASPPNLTKEWKRIYRLWDEWSTAEVQRQRRRERKELRRQALELEMRLKREQKHDYYVRRKQRIADSIERLVANGYVLGEHFTKNNAISFAAEVLVEMMPGVYANRMLPETVEVKE